MKEAEIAKEEFEIGQAMAAQKKWNEAIVRYQKALEIDQYIYDAYINLGDIFRKQDKLDRSLEYYESLINLRDSDGNKIIAPQLNKALEKVYIRLQRLLENSNILVSQLEKIREIAISVLEINPHHKAVTKLLIYTLSFIALTKVKEAKGFCQEVAYYNNLQTKPNFVQKHWQDGKLNGPNFIIIGFMKCATTSLYDYMVQHPQILPASQKEIMFFNNDQLFEMGLDWYVANFPPISEHSGYLTGEASTLYIQNAKAAYRLKESFPKTKLIVILRNPVERAISHYYFNIKIARNVNNTIEKAMNFGIKKIKEMKDISQEIDGKSDYISSGLYIYFLEKWLNIFPKEQFLFLRTEDLAKNPQETLNQVFQFLELPESTIKQYSKQNSGSYKPISDDLKFTLSEFYKPFNLKLQDRLERDFHWQ